MPKLPYCRRTIVLVGALSLLAFAVARLEAEPEAGIESRQLIALLPPEGDPVVIADAINNPSPSKPIPYGLDTAGPTAAEPLILRRPTSTTLQWVQANPDRPLSRLYRYLVLTYAPATDVDTVRSALESLGELQHVERNLTFELQAALQPADPLLGSPGQPVNSSQWGSHALRLPEAWEWSKGHTPIGFLDTGVEVAHDELKTWTQGAEALVLNGGNVREHLSYNWRTTSCDIDEKTIDMLQAGHGSHTTGIAAAATNNGNGVSGACWNCPVEMQLTFGRNEHGDLDTAFNNAAAGLTALGAAGAPIVNMSFAASGFYTCSPASFPAFCNALALAAERDQVLTVSAGNNKQTLGFPATDPRTLAIGGAERDLAAPFGFARWDDCPVSGIECGSNFGPELDLVAPAKEVLSTVYTDLDHLATCGDSADGIPGNGYGLCTGTSMSAPYVAGIVGLVRSVQPLLDRDEVRDVLLSTASHFGDFTETLGNGLPLADAAVKQALGSVGGQNLNNRLTPLFLFYSPLAEVHALTPWPSEALAFLFAADEPFEGRGPLAPGYLAFPGFDNCTISPCPATTPRSSFSVFTSDRQVPGLPPLVPLYRMRFDTDHYWRCQPNNVHYPTLSFGYSSTAGGVEYFKNEILGHVIPGNMDSLLIGYELDGILGYIIPRCSPEPACMPPGTTRLRRLYHPQKDDYLIFPDEETAYWQSQGYVETTTLSTVLGYVYANTDSDFDGLIDGFEDLIGTKRNVYDTDCDGMPDGAEILNYDSSLHNYSDPLEGPCGYLFVDGFETGDTVRWSLTSFVDDGIGF